MLSGYIFHIVLGLNNFTVSQNNFSLLFHFDRANERKNYEGIREGVHQKFGKYQKKQLNEKKKTFHRLCEKKKWDDKNFFNFLYNKKWKKNSKRNL